MPLAMGSVPDCVGPWEHQDSRACAAVRGRGRR